MSNEERAMSSFYSESDADTSGAVGNEAPGGSPDRSYGLAVIGLDPARFEDPDFDVTAFVDRLCEAALPAGALERMMEENDTTEFESTKLGCVMKSTLDDLEELSLKMTTQLRKEQELVKKEIDEQTATLNKRKTQHANCYESFLKLEQDVSRMTQKITPFIDQLETISQPRSRLSEAKSLIDQFNDFMTNSFPEDKFAREEERLPMFVEQLPKLKEVFGELDQPQFQSAVGNIRSAYDSLEQFLADRFQLALTEDDVAGMSKHAHLLSSFDSYHQNCVRMFVDQVVNEFAPESEHLLEDILSRCEEIAQRIQAVFPDAEVVSANYYHPKLFRDVIQSNPVMDVIHKSLQSTDSDNRAAQMSKLQLEMLSRSEKKIRKFCERLARKNILVSKDTLDAQKNQLFAPYLNLYIENEKSALSDFCEEVAQQFYSKAGHVKKNAAQLKALAKRPLKESHDYPSLLFRDELTQIFKEAKASIARASRLLTSASDKNELGRIIFDILVSVVLDGNVIYVISLANEGTPCTRSDLRDLKTEPDLNFFPLVARCNSIINEFNTAYFNYLLKDDENNTGVGLIAYQSKAWYQCEKKRKLKIKEAETLINHTVEKVLNYYSAWIKKLYAAQSPLAFQKAGEESAMEGQTEACRQVCAFVSKVISYTKRQVPATCSAADNQEIINEFGIKFHQCLLSQIKRLKFSPYGGIQLCMDLSEYKKVVDLFNDPHLVELFRSLQALCNLLITPSEHLLSVINGPDLEGVEQGEVHDFVKLRVDYRQNILKRLFGPNPFSQ